MPILVLSLFRFVRILLSGHVAVAMENAALRVQLVAFQRKPKRPALTSFDRLFWVGLSLLWTGWRAPLVYVRADTVVRWRRERFRRFWARRSRVNQRHRGRPATAVEIRRLIERMVAANPFWRTQDSRRVEDARHRDLRTYCLANSPETAAAARPDLGDVPGIHLPQMVSLNFFTVPTITLKVLFVFIVLEHRRREVLQLQRDGPPRGSLDVSADYRGLRRARHFALFAAGSGRRLWQRRSVAYGFAANRGNPHGAPQPLAASIRRAAHRLDPQRVSGPLHHP